MPYAATTSFKQKRFAYLKVSPQTYIISSVNGVLNNFSLPVPLVSVLTN